MEVLLTNFSRSQWSYEASDVVNEQLLGSPADTGSDDTFEDSMTRRSRLTRSKDLQFFLA